MTDYHACTKCGSFSNSEDKLCFDCLAKNIGIFWEASEARVTMRSDGDQFVTEIRAGIEGETYLSVGYSCPNYAWIDESMIAKLREELNKKWKDIDKVELDDMLPALYEMCKVANKTYNDLLFQKTN